MNGSEGKVRHTSTLTKVAAYGKTLATAAVLASLLAGLLPPATVWAQGEVVLGNLGVDLWPEYDRDAVLVIYRITIAPEVELPAPLRFRIPAAAGNPNAVAEHSVDGQLVTVPYNRTVDGDQAVIQFSASQPEIQIEYYDPRIEREGTVHRFWFNWPGDYAVNGFGFSVQQPARAEDLIMVPAATSQSTGGDRLIYHKLGLPAAAAGESFEIFVEYTKTSDELSAEVLSPATSSPSAGSASVSRAPVGGVLIAAVVVVVVVAAGVVGWRFRGRGATVADGRAPRSERGSSRARSGSKFCTQCGAEASGEDRFCNACGVELR